MKAYGPVVLTIHRIAAALLVLAPAAASAATPDSRSRTLITIEGRQQPAWFLCDALDAPTIQVVGKPDAKRRLVIAAYSKTRPGAPLIHDYDLGPADPGAGNIHYALSQNGAEVGFLHAVNPGMLERPGLALTPTFTSLRLDGRELSCRWLEGTRLIGFDDRRTFVVTQDAAGRLRYQTFDFADTAKARALPPDGAQRTTASTLDIGNGVESVTKDGAIFQFLNNGYSYKVQVPSRPSAPASVQVTHSGRVIQREVLAAYTYAPKPPSR